MTRRSWYGLGAALLCLALLPMGWLLLRRSPEPTPRIPPRTEQGCDALCGRTRAELNDFASWLAGNQARGYIGDKDERHRKPRWPQATSWSGSTAR